MNRNHRTIACQISSILTLIWETALFNFIYMASLNFHLKLVVFVTDYGEIIKFKFHYPTSVLRVFNSWFRPIIRFSWIYLFWPKLHSLFRQCTDVRIRKQLNRKRKFVCCMSGRQFSTKGIAGDEKSFDLILALLIIMERMG